MLITPYICQKFLKLYCEIFNCCMPKILYSSVVPLNFYEIENYFFLCSWIKYCNCGNLNGMENYVEPSVGSVKIECKCDVSNLFLDKATYICRQESQ